MDVHPAFLGSSGALGATDHPAAMASTRVTVVSTSRVRAAAPTRLNERLTLSPVDTIMPFYPIDVAMLFKCKGNPKTFMPFDALKLSLAAALNKFPHLAGTVVKNSKLQSGYELLFDNRGPGVVEAFVAHPFSWDAMEPEKWPAGLATGSVEDPLRVQLTRFSCGSVVLVAGMSHLVCDASASFTFMRHWAQLNRTGSSDVSPSLDNKQMFGTDASQIQADYKAEEFLWHGEKFPFLPGVGRIVKYSPAQLAAMKAAATGKQADAKDWVSTNDALMAHWAQLTTKHRKWHITEPQKDVRIGWALDARHRLQPPLPEEYSFNATYFATAFPKAKELVEMPFPQAARLFRRVTDSWDTRRLRSATEWLSSRSDLGSIGRTIWPGCFGITNWAKFDMYNADFGFGRPQYSGCLPAANDEFMFIMSSPEPGGLVCLIQCDEAVLNAVRADPEFLAYQGGDKAESKRAAVETKATAAASVPDCASQQCAGCCDDEPEAGRRAQPATPRRWLLAAAGAVLGVAVAAAWASRRKL